LHYHTGNLNEARTKATKDKSGPPGEDWAPCCKRIEPEANLWCPRLLWDLVACKESRIFGIRWVI